MGRTAQAHFIWAKPVSKAHFNFRQFYSFTWHNIKSVPLSFRISYLKCKLHDINPLSGWSCNRFNFITEESRSLPFALSFSPISIQYNHRNTTAPAGYSHWYLYGIWFELLHKTQCDQFTACSQLRRSTYSMQLGHFQAIFINFRRISRSRKVPMNGHILKVSFAKQFPLWISSDLIFILENRNLLWIYCTAIQNGVAHLGFEVIQNSQMNPISERKHPNF